MADIVRWTFTAPDGETVLETPAGMTVLEALRSEPQAFLPAPCAGRGRCGRCRIVVEGEAIPRPDPTERELLSEEDLADGVRLACRTRPAADLRIRRDDPGRARIHTETGGLVAGVDPLVSRQLLKIPPGHLEDQRDLAERLSTALDRKPGRIPLWLLKDLPSPTAVAPVVTAVGLPGEIVSLESGDFRDMSWTAAVDIGTTTVAAYLVDASGTVIDSAASLNAQAPWGADVVSRLEYARTGSSGARDLQQAIVRQLTSLLGELTARNGVPPEYLHALTVTGNTAMIHFLAGLDSTGLGESPFLPTAREIPPFPSWEIGITGFSRLWIVCLPCISAYVGADIVAGILAAGMHTRKETCLLLDIGTNGEMALGNRDRLICCSTAAGPAFEGAHLSAGLGSVPGAVDHVDLRDGELFFTTIDDAPAAGFCGSGIVDLTAFLLRAGLADDTGRLDEDPSRSPSGLSIRPGDAGSELVWDAGITRGRELTFTQKDLREVQLAKAALAAGVETLLAVTETDVEDIDTVFLAGGFGNYIRPESAAVIGLLPPALSGKVRSLGNAAARGALMTLLSRRHMDEAIHIARNAESLELSGREDFRHHYVESLFFPV